MAHEGWPGDTAMERQAQAQDRGAAGTTPAMRGRSRIARVHRGLALACLLLTMPAWAQQAAMETITNTVAPANSGPTGSGPTAASQTVILRHNTDNPTGIAMAATTPPLTVTYSLTSQQFTSLNSTFFPTATTGGNGVFFGGGGTPVFGGSSAPSSLLLYQSYGSLGSPLATHYTSVNATTGAGISTTANAGVLLSVSGTAVGFGAPSTPTTARVRMADLVLDFSAPVSNPILHLNGLGGVYGSAFPWDPKLGFTTEFEIVSNDGVTPAPTITRLSGNTVFTVSGSQINNTAGVVGASCTANLGACGSVRVNGTNLSRVTLRIYLRGDGGYADWRSSDPSQHSIDGSLIGVSVNRPAWLTLRKTSVGGTGSFTFSGTNGVATQTLTTITAGTPVSGTRQALTAASTSTTITEDAPPAGYRLTDIACTGVPTGGTVTPDLTAGTVTLNAAATAPGADIVCTFTNSRRPRVTLRKISEGGVGAFTFTGNNGMAAQTLTTTTAGAPVSGAVQTLTAAAATTTITEGTPPAGYRLTAASCTGVPAGSTATADLTARTITLVTTAAAATADIVCTFTNTLQPRVTIRKTSVGGIGSFAFSGDNGIAAQTLTTTAAGTPQAGAVQTLTAANTITTITEGTPPAGYTLTAASCTGLPAGGAATPDLTARTLALNAAATAPGANVTCTFTNTFSAQTDLSIEKSATPGTVTSGGQVQFTLVVANLGPLAANGATVRDPAVAGLDCTAAGLPAPTCTGTPSTTTVCPTAAALTAANLHSPAGVAIPALPSGGVATILLTCNVTATGF